MPVGECTGTRTSHDERIATPVNGHPVSSPWALVLSGSSWKLNPQRFRTGLTVTALMAEILPLRKNASTMGVLPLGA